MTKEEKLKAIEYIFSELRYTNSKRKTDSIKYEKLESLNVDTTKNNIVIGNLELSKILFSKNYSVNYIDKKRDWKGDLISENKLLEEKVLKLYKQNEEKITRDELLHLKLDLHESTYLIGRNFKLNYEIFLFNYYIELVDKQKDGRGRWKTEYIDVRKVRTAIDDYPLTKQFYKNYSEPKLNTELKKHLENYFEKVREQTNNENGRLDIKIGDNDFVIEIKMAKSLKNKSKYKEAIGQIMDYLNSKRLESKKFMLLIVCEKSEEDEPNILELINHCQKDFKCHWDYLTAK